jgi:hypothetical protein
VAQDRAPPLAQDARSAVCEATTSVSGDRWQDRLSIPSLRALRIRRGAAKWAASQAGYWHIAGLDRIADEGSLPPGHPLARVAGCHRFGRRPTSSRTNPEPERFAAGV